MSRPADPMVRSMTDPSTGPRLRKALRGIPSYKPGRPAAAATDRPTYKLSSNENPFPPLPALTEAAHEASRVMNRYPDLTCGRLVGALSDRLDVPPGHFATGTGSVALLYHLLQATCEPGDEVMYAWRSFEAYPIAAQVAGATRIEVPLTTGARHDLTAMAAAITDRTRVVIVCTPNNPTGPVVTHQELAEFCARVPSDVLIVVDEAYLQFVRDPEAADGLALYREYPNVCVLRTFSKAYCLANFRVGYAIAHDPVAEALRVCTPPFAVSSVAEEAALAALACENELLEQVEVLVKERTRVAEGLRALGYDVPVTEANFSWVPLGADTQAFARACEEGGVVVRPFGDEGCRVSVGEPAANDLFLELAGRWAARAR
ncbi:histidinol-phosphate aminotransferase [Actinopolymorpha cephalotaxi]|uniref:Aromatic amino acid aminotransferase n=2 Tax=Actinopolymorpha cephalotaxi TaxID=504797 RepID=A0A1I2U3R7_9ACTN|nr:histidinol-phosphate aminotransferase [Actinopolymorpha cephalotaxi]